MPRSVILVIVAVTMATILAIYSLTRGAEVAAEPYQAPTASREDLIAASETRLFFAHQSVGGNILDGVADVYRANGLPTPHVAEVADADPDAHLLHTRIGANGDPLGKISDFDSLIRGGLGDDVDVAVLKLCYSDVRDDTDLDEVFATYTGTIRALQEDYPDVTFLAATVPLSIQRSPAGTLKEWLGRGDKYGAEHNVAREKFNARLRAEFAGTDLLFDVASIESTTQGGERVAALHDGALYYSLDRAYAKDPGHLNESGAAVVANGLLAVVAKAHRD